MRRAVWLCLLTLAMLFIAPRSAHATFDPTLRWYTIETEHFRITYHSGLEEVAQHVANTSESIYGGLTVAMGYIPTKDKTEISLADVTESANGSASALPYNAVRLIVTAPEDFSPLGDVDDWYYELFTHEYTHVLHTDNIHGIPALVNAVLGKTLAPNQVQPRWLLEGYGVFQESNRTSAGRLRNSMWDMWMRTDVLEDNVASLAQISNIVRRWPQGNLFYLYGSYFMQWIAATYGEDSLRKMSRDYGSQLIPWGIQRTIRRATGKTYDELYPMWIASMKARYGEQAAKIRKQGIREGRRITFSGQVSRYPRWIPDNAWTEHRGGLLYYRDDQHYRAGLFALDLERDAQGSVTKSDWEHSDLIARTLTESVSSFTPDGGLVFGTADYYKNYFVFNDIERLDQGQKSPYGPPDGMRRRVTEPIQRASDPAVSPDGRKIVFTENRRGTRSLHIADFEPRGQDGIANAMPLTPSGFLEQAFTPRWSPDGKKVVYSVWKRGGSRDVRIIDVATGAIQELTQDRAVDGAPMFSPDGRHVLFHSDRTGVMNIYAYEIATGKLRQVTNVLTGAYAPDISPDGKTLAYVGYTKVGWDIFAMRIDESEWTDADAYDDPHPPAPTIPTRRFESKPYSPWRTIQPRKYGVQYTQGSFGDAVIINALGVDITGMHAVSFTSVTELEKPELQGSISYSYGALPVDFSISAFRSIAPRAGYQIGQYKPTVIQETAGLSSTLAYAQGTASDSRAYVVSHSVARVGAEYPLPIDKIDPYETPNFPPRGLASAIHFGYSFSNAERYLWSVGGERGYSVNLGFDVTDQTLGSDFSGFVANGDFITYYLLPWGKHHSLALHAGGGTSGGSFPGRGAFYVGSFVDVPVLDTVRNLVFQGGITLRGYQPVALAGRSYALTNVEYRFPIVNIDQGDSTLPIFINRITGNVFFDYGSAFDVFADARFKSGTGAELWFDTTLGYVASFTWRVGYARGLASSGIDKMYFVAAIPF